MKKKFFILVSEEQEKILGYFGFSIDNFLRAGVVARVEPSYYPIAHSKWKIIELESIFYQILFDKSLETRIPLEEYCHFLLWELIYQLLRRSCF